jgi:outer membrane protein OmpA-like peptidoglycan-associated protein
LTCALPAAFADTALDPDQAPAAPAGTEPNTGASQDRREGLEVLARGVALTVYFRSGSTLVGDDTAARIRLLGEFLGRYPELRVYLDAHSDRRGSNASNRRLSRARADTVARLLQQSGIPRERILGNAWGEAQASAPIDDPEGQLFDRRVEVQLGLDPQA